MKLLTLFLIGLLTLSCTREETFEGNISISGYCYDACEEKSLANYTVRFENEDITFETRTDSNGYFEIIEDYSFTYLSKNAPGYGHVYIRDEQLPYKACGQYFNSAFSPIQNDTVFFNQVVNTELRVKIDPTKTTTQEDTIFIRINSESCQGPERPFYSSNHTSDRGTYYISYNEYYVGPFENNQVLDTLLTWVDPRVTKSLSGISSTNCFISGPNLGNQGSNWTYYTPSTNGNDVECNSLQLVEIDLNN